MNERKPWLAYYGDDFTGSTDAMEALAASGVRTVLFLRTPTAEMLCEERFAGMRAFGIAGVARSLPPDEMERELTEAFGALRRSKAAICHYKICSTFDSSPHIGSIGKALDTAAAIFAEQRFIPLVAGVPALGRYTAFGHHFASYAGSVYRLDRHPVMSRHPTTPMDESDLRALLVRQTELPVGSIDLTMLQGEEERSFAAVEACITPEPGVLLFDVTDEDMLARIGAILVREARRGQLFVAGSSGIEYALASVWRSAGLTEEVSEPPSAAKSPQGPVLVLSGSCSPVTGAQISFALEHGFKGIQAQCELLLDPLSEEAEAQRIVRETAAALSAGQSVIVYTARNGDDPAIDRVRTALAASGRKPSDSGRLLGEPLGRICRSAVEASCVARVVIAGGDTSGYVLKQLDIYALEMIKKVVPGGPLCGAHSEQARFDGLEISLKGGQVGAPDYFVRVRNA